MPGIPYGKFWLCDKESMNEEVEGILHFFQINALSLP
jgi:hypothetical protein